MKKKCLILCVVFATLVGCTKETFTEEFVSAAAIENQKSDYNVANKMTCERNPCVGYWGMPDELNYLMDCLYPPSFCNNPTSTTTYTWGYDDWLFSGSSDENFTIEQQDDLLQAARNYAQNLDVPCSNPNITYDFFLDFLVCGGCSSSYYIGVNITLTCCSSGPVGPDAPGPVPGPVPGYPEMYY